MQSLPKSFNDPLPATGPAQRGVRGYGQNRKHDLIGGNATDFVVSLTTLPSISEQTTTAL